jgi:hypothetical protein
MCVLRTCSVSKVLNRFLFFDEKQSSPLTNCYKYKAETHFQECPQTIENLNGLLFEAVCEETKN